jgi:hypothetical protein
MEEAAAAEIGQAVEDDVKHARFHDRMKQRSLYVDIQGSGFTHRASRSRQNELGRSSWWRRSIKLVRGFIDHVEAEGETPIEELRRRYAAAERKLMEAILSTESPTERED